MYAAHFGSLEAVTTLIDAGADPRALASCGWPALFYAVEASKRPLPAPGRESNPHLEVIRLFVDRDKAEGAILVGEAEKTRMPSRHRAALACTLHQQLPPQYAILACNSLGPLPHFSWCVEGKWFTEGKGRTALMVAAMQDADEAAELLCQLQPWSVRSSAADNSSQYLLLPFSPGARPPSSGCAFRSGGHESRSDSQHKATFLP